MPMRGRATENRLQLMNVPDNCEAVVTSFFAGHDEESFWNEMQPIKSWLQSMPESMPESIRMSIFFKIMVDAKRINHHADRC